MDSLLELLPLLFVAAYYLLRARSRAAQQRQARQRQTAPQEPLIDGEREPTPFQSFLQQVESAMAEAAGEAPARETDQRLEVEREPLPSPLPAPPAKPVRPAPPPEFRAPIGSFDSVRPPSHERHGFGAENPLSEETFEHLPPQPAPRRERAAYDPHDLAARQRSAPRRLTVADWRRRLADPAAAREAYVLQTIFGERGGRARETRR